MKFSSFRKLYADAAAHTDPNLYIAECGAAYCRQDLLYIFKLSKMDIKELRGELGLSQAGFFNFCGIPTRTIENWEAQAENTTRKVKDYIVIFIAYAVFSEKSGEK